MSYCRLSEAYWNDDVIRGITEPARYFMLYLMSCKHTNRLGLFVLDPGYAASDLDCDDVAWKRDKVERLLEELRDADRVGWDPRTRSVFVRHYLRHNVLHNASVVMGALNDLAGLPTTFLLGDLLDTVIEERKGESGPKLVHYAPLEDELRRRCLLAGVDWKNGGDIEEKHGVPHGAGHGAGHRRRAGARNRTVPDRTVPSLTEPDRTDPTRTGRGEHGGREDDIDLEKEIRACLTEARRNIVAIHGSAEQVEIEGHLLGVGIEIDAFKRLCRSGSDPPHIIAAAIAHLPAVCGLEPPVSLARWTSDEGQPVYEQCVGRAYQGEASEFQAPLSKLEEHFQQQAARAAKEEAS